MEKTVFVYTCPNCHKPITSRLEKFRCWYCNTYYDNTSGWEIKEMSESELNNQQGKIITPQEPPATIPVPTPVPIQTPIPPVTAAVPNYVPNYNGIPPTNVIDNKPWEFKWEKISSGWQAVIGILIALCIFSIFIDPNPTSTIRTVIGLLIGWFWTGPWCWKIAYEKGRNQLWAFSIGMFFSIIGALLYWVYLLFFKQVRNIPLE